MPIGGGFDTSASPTYTTSTPDTRPACERDGHDFRQRRDADGAYTTWLYCRRCGKQRRLGAVPAQ